MAGRARTPAALLAVLVLGGAALTARSADSATALTSPNWGGYATVSRDSEVPVSFTSATGTWTQPAAKCAAGDDYSEVAIWVGIGGFSSERIEQVGTQIACNAKDPPSYTAWYELAPADPHPLNLVVMPGDVVTASVNVTDKHVVMQLIDRTRHTRATKRVTAGSVDLSSAEWIGEATTPCRQNACSELPLANFGAFAFSRIATVGDGHPGTLTDTSWQAIPIQLVPKPAEGYGGFRNADAFPSSTAGTSPPALISQDGRAFSLRWRASLNPSSG